MAIKEIDGMVDARKVSMSGTEKQRVDVIDGKAEVFLELSTSNYPAGLSRQALKTAGFRGVSAPGHPGRF